MKPRVLIVDLLDCSASMGGNAHTYDSTRREYFDSLKLDQNAEFFVISVHFDVNPTVVSLGVPLKDFTMPAYAPVGLRTNWYDAIIKATDVADAWLKSESAKGRNYNVIFEIMSDGEHNLTVKHSRMEALDKVEEKERSGFWTMAFLGATKEALQTADAIGLPGVMYTADDKGIPMAGAALFSATRVYTENLAHGRMTNTMDFNSLMAKDLDERRADENNN